MSKQQIPQFTLTCIITAYPKHLLVGTKYKIDTTKKSDNEVPVYWLNPKDSTWVLIGMFGLDCFDTAPIKKWIEENKSEVKPRKRL